MHVPVALPLLLATYSAVFAAPNPALQTIYLPGIISEDGWQKTVLLTNSSNASISVTVTAFNRYGAHLARVEALDRVEANHSKTIDSEILPRGTASLSIESEAALSVHAIVQSRDGRQAETWRGANEKSPQLDFPTLFAHDQRYKMITLLNSSFGTANVDVLAFDAAGRPLDRKSVPALAVMESVDLAPAELFPPDTLEQTALFRILADQKILGMQRATAPSGDLVALSAVVKAHDDAVIPIPSDRHGIDRWTSVGLFNGGENDITGKVEFLDSTSAPIGSPAEMQVIARSTSFLLSANRGGAIPGNAAFLKVRSTAPVSVYAIYGNVDGAGITSMRSTDFSEMFELAGSSDRRTLSLMPKLRSEDVPVASAPNHFVQAMAIAPAGAITMTDGREISSKQSDPSEIRDGRPFDRVIHPEAIQRHDAVGNDDPSTATLIPSLPFNVAEDTTNASVSTFDPFQSCTGLQDSNTVWFRFVASFSGNVRVSTSGSTYDTVLSVYPGTSRIGPEISCDDDVAPKGGFFVILQAQLTFRVTQGQSYLIEASRFGTIPGVGTLSLHVFSVTPRAAKAGIFRATTGTWVVDDDGNGNFDGAPPDRIFNIGQNGDVPVVGNWNGSGSVSGGVFRAGQWFLDFNGTGSASFSFNLGQAGDIPVVGDWDGSGFDRVGIFRNGQWVLDINGNGSYDPGIDKVFSLGTAGDIPVVGDWNGDGRIKIGIFRNGTWFLDMNGNGQYDGPLFDRVISLGQAGDVPVVGDWNNSGFAKVGIFRNGLWALDFNGDGVFGAGDRIYSLGTAGDIPVVGDWYGNGFTGTGIFRNGVWVLDFNSSGTFTGPPLDTAFSIGQAGDRPVVGPW